MQHQIPCEACGSLFEEQRLTKIDTKPPMGVNMLMCGFCAMDHRKFQDVDPTQERPSKPRYREPDSHPEKPPRNRHPYNRALNKEH
jgi:hypothetical protein